MARILNKISKLSVMTLILNRSVYKTPINFHKTLQFIYKTPVNFHKWHKKPSIPPQKISQLSQVTQKPFHFITKPFAHSIINSPTPQPKPIIIITSSFVFESRCLNVQYEAVCCLCVRAVLHTRLMVVYDTDGERIEERSVCTRSVLCVQRAHGVFEVEWLCVG